MSEEQAGYKSWKQIEQEYYDRQCEQQFDQLKERGLLKEVCFDLRAEYDRGKQMADGWKYTILGDSLTEKECMVFCFPHKPTFSVFSRWVMAELSKSAVSVKTMLVDWNKVTLNDLPLTSLSANAFYQKTHFYQPENDPSIKSDE